MNTSMLQTFLHLLHISGHSSSRLVILYKQQSQDDFIIITRYIVHISIIGININCDCYSSEKGNNYIVYSCSPLL